MTWKAEVSDSAVQSMTVLREPIQTTENEGEKNFSALRTERPSLRTPIHCLWQWPYHSKIPRAGTEIDQSYMPFLPTHQFIIQLHTFLEDP